MKLNKKIDVVRGFSLVELSIVLVILGLLVGGVLTGQSLIRAAELRSVATEFQQYQTAVQTFRDRFFSIPGDMRNAEDFWGTANAANTACVTAAAIGTLTCNGNGDGQIDISTRSNERFRFWQHLANAGLIEGAYTGVAGPGSTDDSLIAENVPSSSLGNAGWHVRFLGTAAANSANYDLDYGNAFAFGADEVSFLTAAPILTPEEAWNIDTKIDDGRPASGKVIARFWNGLCSEANDGSNANDDFDASYRLSDSSVRCALFFRDPF